MPQYSQTMTFTASGNTATVAAPSPGYAPAYDRAQHRGRNAAGDWYVYDKAIGRFGATMSLLLTEVQQIQLNFFFVNVVVGALNTFTWVDHRGHTYTGCRFNQHRIEFTKTPGRRYRCQLEIITAEEVR